MTLAEIFRTTTLRWSVAIAAALLVQSAALAALFYTMTARHAIASVDRALVADCRSVAGLTRGALVADIEKRVANDVHRVNLVGLFDPDGTPVVGNIAHIPPALAQADGPAVVGLVRTQPPDPAPNASRAIVCPLLDGTRVVFAKDTDELDYISSLSRKALVGATVPVLALAGGLGLILSSRAQRRFLRVKTAIDDVMAGDLHRRLPVRTSRDPFDRLSLAVNAMLDRLEVAIGDLKGMGDDLAHELRTPLTRLRARLERGCQDALTPDAFRAVGDRAIHDIDHALSIISAILRIRAIEESRRGSEFRDVELKTLLEDAVDLYRPTAEDRQVTLAMEAPRGARVTADRDLLMEALCNLIDNAIKFTPARGHVGCRLEVRDDGVALLRIVDNGCGIPSDERAAVMRRFHRSSRLSDADGHGIGLSLVAAITNLHGFTLAIEDVAAGSNIAIVCAQTPPTETSRHGERALSPRAHSLWRKDL